MGMETNSVLKSKLIYVLFSLLLAGGCTYLLVEPAFTHSQIYVIFLLFLSIGLWFTEAVPAFSVALFIMFYLVVMLGSKMLNPEPVPKIMSYVNTFSSKAIWLLMGGLFMAAGMSKTKLDVSLFKFALKKSGSTPKGLVAWIMTATMISSMLMSNTAATAMAIAMVMPLLKNIKQNDGLSKTLLIGIPLAASTGGMATIIGTPPNAIAVDALQKSGIHVDFLTWMLYGTPLAVILTILCGYALIKVFIKDNSPIILEIVSGNTDDTSNTLQRKIVVYTLFFTLLLWLTGSVHGIDVTLISAIPILIFTLTGVLTAKDSQVISWDSLLLIAGALSLGMALQDTGLLSHYAGKIGSIGISGWVLVLFIAFITMLLSNIMSNTAVATILIPLVAVLLPESIGEGALVVALSSSTALFLPISTPPNVISFGTGMLKQKDFRFGGTLAGLIGPTLVVMWVLFLTKLI